MAVTGPTSASFEQEISTREMGISRLSGEFTEPELEHEFRGSFYEAQRRQVRTFAILTAVLFMPVGSIEYMNTGHLDGFDLFLVGHFFSGVLTVLMGFAVYRRWSYRALELICLTYFLYVVVESAYLLHLYQDEIYGIVVRLPLYAAAGNVLVILSWRSRIVLNAFAAPFFVGAVWGLGTISGDAAGSVSLFVFIGMLFGVLGGHWINRTRRVEFYRRRLLVASNAALLEARHRAEAAVAAKTMFLANVSHELRTPLNAIIGFSQMIQTGIHGPLGNRRYQDYMGDIHDSGNHLLELIDDLLDLTKIEAGKLDQRAEWIPLEQACLDCVRTVRASMHDSQPRLIEVAVSDSVEIWFDPQAFRQIATNLLTNAIKYAGPDASIRIDGVARPDGGMVVSVVDDGVGMPEDALARIMRPFEQQDATISRKQQGWGLGLPLTRALAEANEAKLSMSSSPGNGTKAWLEIGPAHLRTAAEDVQAAPIARASMTA